MLWLILLDNMSRLYWSFLISDLCIVINDIHHCSRKGNGLLVFVPKGPVLQKQLKLKLLKVCMSVGDHRSRTKKSV